MAYFEDDNSNINDAYLAAQGGQVDQLGELFGQYAYDPSYYDFSAVGGGAAPTGDPAWMTAGAPSFDAAMQDWYNTESPFAGYTDDASADYAGYNLNNGGFDLQQFNQALLGASSGTETLDERVDRRMWGERGIYTDPSMYDPAFDPTKNPSMIPGGVKGPKDWNSMGTSEFIPNRLGPNNPFTPGMASSMAKSGIYNPDGSLANPGAGFGGVGKTGFRSWDGTGGPGGAGGSGRGSGGSSGDISRMIQGYNDAVARARNAATADRQQALNAVAQWRQLIEQRLAKNPFGAEYKAQTLGVVRDARARQYSAAVEELRQAYAQQGKPLDPRLLTMLRMQMAREENGDLRNLSIDTAGKAYAADTSYVNEVGQNVSALDRILSNTQHQPNPQELAFLMSLSRGAN